MLTKRCTRHLKVLRFRRGPVEALVILSLTFLKCFAKEEHTDSQPIFTARFPSNWHLSTARTQRVADILEASGALGDRVTHKGRAENDPVAPNDTPEKPLAWTL